MYLKRHYEPASLDAWRTKRDEVVGIRLAALMDSSPEAIALHGEEATRKRLQEQFTAENGLPEITHIEVLNVGAEQKLSINFIDTGIEEGWLSLADGKITIKTGPDDEDLVFKVERRPGKYSCYTGERLGSEKAAREHVAQFEDASPDPNNPSGWRDDRFYACVRESDHG